VTNIYSDNIDLQ